eukprot:366426-Chlamydomonas_euryale.AAC.7
MVRSAASFAARRCTSKCMTYACAATSFHTLFARGCRQTRTRGGSDLWRRRRMASAVTAAGGSRHSGAGMPLWAQPIGFAPSLLLTLSMTATALRSRARRSADRIAGRCCRRAACPRHAAWMRRAADVRSAYTRIVLWNSATASRIARAWVATRRASMPRAKRWTVTAEAHCRCSVRRAARPRAAACSVVAALRCARSDSMACRRRQ